MAVKKRIEKKKGKKFSKAKNDFLLEASKLNTPQLYERIKTNPAGLSLDEVKERQDKYGLNTIATKKKGGIFKILFQSFINPFSLILLVIAIINLFIDVIFVKQINGADAKTDWSAFAIIMIILVISGIVKFIQESRSSSASEKLKDMIETTAAITREGVKKEIPIEEIVPGDIVSLAAGDMIPGDIYLTKTKDLFIAQSSLTGESEPIEKIAGQLNLKTNSSLDCNNLCFMGTTVVSGTATGVVLSTGNNTFFGSIAKSLNKKRPMTSFNKGIKSISILLLTLMLVMTTIVFLVQGLKGGNESVSNNWIKALVFALSIAVGLTPELLPMIVSVNLSKEAITMSKKKTIVKNLNSIQSFGAMNILCTDKTGTLTEDRIVLERHLNIHGKEDNRVLMYGYLNSHYQTGLKNLLDLAIIERAEAKKMDHIKDEFDKIDEIPFDFKRRRMSVIIKNKINGQVSLITKGAIEEMLSISKYVEYNNKISLLTPSIKKEILGIVNNLNAEGMRVIAIAKNYKKLTGHKTFSIDDESSMCLMGYISLLDPPKASAKKAINALQKKGVKIKVLTGDNANVTNFVCKQVGILSEEIVLGSDIEDLDDEALIKLVRRVNIFAKLSPEQKARIVTCCKSGGNVVGYMGDGINDAPAMRVADVGISVDSAVDIAKETADFVLLEKDLSVLESGVTEGRKTYANIMKYMKMTISGNFGNMLSMMIASIWLSFEPMLPVQILILNLIYDFSQMTIPWDNVDKDFLEKPRPWDTTSLLKFMFCIGPISTIFDIATFLVMYFYFGWNSSDQASLFHTGWFIESLLSQMLIIYFLRSPKLPFFKTNPSLPVVSASIILSGVGVSICLIPGVSSYLGFANNIDSLFFAFLIGILLLYATTAQIGKMTYIKGFKSWL